MYTQNVCINITIPNRIMNIIACLLVNNMLISYQEIPPPYLHNKQKKRCVSQI